MVNIMMGLEGSGKTKQLIDAMNYALNREAGVVVCLENGNALRYDVDHRVRLIDASEYAISDYAMLRGFVSGLHAGNFDISHIFIDNLLKISRSKDPRETEVFLDWCSLFSADNGVSFTITIPGDPSNAPDYIARFMD